MVDFTADIAPLKKMLDEARTALEPQRSRSLKARDYYDGNQLSSKQKSTLRTRKQPETVRNRIGPAIDGVLGLLEQAKVDPRAYPRNPQDEDSADVATKCLQYVSDQNRFHKMKLDCADNHLVEGASAVIVEANENGDVKINQIRFEEFFYDPYSRQADFRDARYMGIGKWMYASDLARMFPEEADMINSTVTASDTIMGDVTWDDKPDSVVPWIDRKQRRLMVVEMYHRENQWMRSLFCAAGLLEQTPSPYVDEEGQPMCPIEGSSCFVSRELERYGLVERMVSLQDELNARASRGLHLLNSRQLQVSDPNFPPEADSNTARAEAAKADGVIPLGYAISPTTDMAQGNLAVMQEVSQSIDRLAPTPALLGRADGSNQSGRSRLVLQQAGMTEIARPLGRFEDWENRVYRQVWLRIKQFWTAQKYIRVTDEEGSPEFLQINEPIIARQPLVNPMTGQPVINPETGEPMTQVVMQPQPVMGPDGQPQLDPMGQPVMQMQPVVIGYDHRVAEMDMDIIVDTVPDSANLATEQFQMLSQLATAYGPEKVPFEVLLEVSSLPNKRKVKEMLENGQAVPPQVQQMQAQAMQIEQAEKQAGIEKDKSQAMLNMARAEAEKVSSATEIFQAQQSAIQTLAQPENTGV